MTSRTPPTIDEMADILPSLVRALSDIVGMMEGLVDVACHATNIQESTADTLADYAHTLMREATERRRTGRGNAPLALRTVPAPADDALQAA